MPNIQLQFRRGTAAQWSAANPTLASGEMGIETDTNQFKVGNGTLAWNSLSYGGIQGPTGATGAMGSPGQGVPTGGSTGQFLSKVSGTNYDTTWTTYTETDPVFSSHAAHNITSTDITKLANLSGVNTGDQNLSGLVPYTGATTTLNLGSQNFQTSGFVGIGTSVGSSRVELRASDTVFTPPTGPVAFSDTFTEASTTLLNAHTPNVGTSYSLVSSTGSATFSVYAATALKPTTTVANSGCLYVANTATTSADMEVSIRIVIVATLDNTIGLVFRYKDSNNFYLLTVSSSYQATRLYKKVAGVWTDLGLMNSLIVGTNGDTWKCRIVGSNIAVYRNDILLKLVTDTSITASGLGGISAGTIGQNATDDVSTTWQLDDFKVQNFSNGGTNELGINIVGSVAASNQILGNGSFTSLKPTFSFQNDTDTGIYRSADNTIGFATSGTERMTIGTSLVTTTPFRTADGSASAPAYSFSNSTASGMYYSAGRLYWSISNTERMKLTNTGQLVLNGSIVYSNFSIACPKAVYNDGGEEGGYLTASNVTGAYGGFFCPDAYNSLWMYSLSSMEFLSGYYGDNTVSDINFTVGTNNFFADAGNLTFSFVTATTSNGGNVSITAGSTSGTGATGGIVTIASGSNTGTNVYSKVSIQPNTGSIAVFGATGRAQATTGIAGATVGGTGGTSITTTSTFDGYTIAQVVAALRQFGWLA